MPNRQIVRHIRKPGRGSARQRERSIQQALARWLREEYPSLDWYLDWASGAYLTTGQNQSRLALASDNDWCDLFLAEPSRGYHGLFLEIKRDDARLYLKDGKTLVADKHIRKQAAFLKRQRAKGYCGMFGRGLETCKERIDWYLQRVRPTNTELF